MPTLPESNHDLLIATIAQFTSSQKRLEVQLDRLADKVGALSEQVAALKVKAGIWGALAGCVPVVVALASLLIAQVYGN